MCHSEALRVAGDFDGFRLLWGARETSGGRQPFDRRVAPALIPAIPEAYATQGRFPARVISASALARMACIGLESSVTAPRPRVGWRGAGRYVTFFTSFFFCVAAFPVLYSNLTWIDLGSGCLGLANCNHVKKSAKGRSVR